MAQMKKSVKVAHFQYWGGLGKFNTSVPFLLTFSFVPLLSVPFLPKLFLYTLYFHLIKTIIHTVVGAM